jgi:hypothetical protein
MSPAFAKPITDLDIEEWVQEQYGFVPHPYWISHCRELFLVENYSWAAEERHTKAAALGKSVQWTNRQE